MITINIKPLSVNQAWQGKRFKTKKYKQYEIDLFYLLPKITIPKGKLEIHYIFYYSNIQSDIDNGIKQFQDILCKKYNFNDKMIYKIIVEKKIVKKGQERIDFLIKCYQSLH